jgi:hypothetical protein
MSTFRGMFKTGIGNGALELGAEQEFAETSAARCHVRVTVIVVRFEGNFDRGCLFRVVCTFSRAFRFLVFFFFFVCVRPQNASISFLLSLAQAFFIFKEKTPKANQNQANYHSIKHAASAHSRERQKER